MMFPIDVADARLLAMLGVEAVALLEGLPLGVSPAVASALSGRSIPSLRAAVDAGELAAEGRRHRRINLAELAAWSGRDAYTAPELAEAFGRITQKAAALPAAGGDDGPRDENLD